MSALYYCVCVCVRVCVFGGGGVVMRGFVRSVKQERRRENIKLMKQVCDGFLNESKCNT